ncbi:MAG: hypothetical protein ACRD0P_22575 [Stackebrandtia sp.]
MEGYDDYEVVVTFTGTATVGLEDEDGSSCTTTKTIAIDDSKHMSCDAKVDIPNDGESRDIYGDAQAVGHIAVNHPDTEALTDLVNTTLDEITKALGD